MLVELSQRLTSVPLPVLLTAGLILVALILYALLAGADYGGGVWDLLASGPRKREQRKLVEKALGPVWEANHVWLIFVVVLLFTGFPSAFAALSTALNIPLTVLLLGIVLRGTSFSFRHYYGRGDAMEDRWGRLFGISSVITPVMLGICIGAISTGDIRVRGGTVVSGFVHPWMELFPVVTGLFTLALFAYLAAVYLTVETEDHALRDDFRRRALFAAVAVGVLAFAALVLSKDYAPLTSRGMMHSEWSIPLQLVTGVLAVGAIACLYWRQCHVARILAGAQVTMILAGWAIAQFPYLIPPDVILAEAAAPIAVLRILLWSVLAGSLILVPSLVYLLRLSHAAMLVAAHPVRKI